MNRVKMNARHEYEYVANYKVMQNVFKAKKIDKVRVFQDFQSAMHLLIFHILQPIPVEKLVKCKMQCVPNTFHYGMTRDQQLTTGTTSSFYSG